MRKFATSLKISFFVWIATVLLSTLLLAFASDGFAKDINEKIWGKPEIFWGALGLLGFLGLFTFLAFFLSSIRFFIKREAAKRRNFAVNFFLVVFAVLTLPVQLFFEALSPISKILQIRLYGLKNFSFTLLVKDIVFAVLILTFTLPVWIGGYSLAGFLGLSQIGLVNEPISVSGTGSMYPTFPKGTSKDPKALGEEVVATAGMLRYPNGIDLGGKKIIGHEIERGDIVVFENAKIRKITKATTGHESGLVKRAIALPGDLIQIRDGIVYLNGKTLKEPYIARARSTYGGETLPDCKTLKIPKGKLFAMGDNRKGSGDSRHDVGLVDYKDIEYVLPFKDQLGKLDRLWHDPSNDDRESSRIVLNEPAYLKLVNSERAAEGLKAFRYEDKLEVSAKKRGEAILKYDDFSFEATKSGYTMKKAMSEAGYSNIATGELPSNGAYEAAEFFEYNLEFPRTREFLLNKDYQDLGISTAVGNLNGCPASVVVLHMAGYIPPNYSPSQVESIKSLLNNLRGAQGGWAGLKDFPSIYDNNKNDVDRINQIISTRISNLSGISAKMEANEWLTEAQENYLKEDIKLGQEQNAIADKLNSR